MHQIEGGVKYILRKNDSETDVYLFEDDQWVYQDDRINNLNYTQHILGLYGGYVFKLKKLSSKAGVRLESTWNDCVFTNKEESKFDNNLFNVVPYVNFAYQLKPSQTIKLGYTQRLSRPGIWYLNPYVNDTDPFNINYSNPNLKSEISHVISTSYSMFKPKFNLNIGLSEFILNNGIESISKIDKDGVRYTTYENIGHRNTLNLNIYGSDFFSTSLISNVEV